LPYQIIATKEQFLRAYPKAAKYFALKEKLDPTTKFRNKLWDHYLSAATPAQKKSPEIRTPHRPEEQTFLTIPEWFIVYSAAEYADFLKSNHPSDFPYFSSIAQFWKVRSGVNQRIDGKYPRNTGYQVMIWVIGLSFSAENFIKGLYENSIGRLTETLSSSPTSGERFMQKVAEDYAHFVRDRPWYEFPFGARLKELWHLEKAPDDPWIRSKERRYYGLLELSGKALYAWIIEKVTASVYDSEDFFLIAKVSGFSTDHASLMLNSFQKTPSPFLVTNRLVRRSHR
jgi:hypothetical protein